MGRLGGLSAAMSNIAGKLKQDRLAQQETTQKRGLLGFSSLLEGKTEIAGPEDTGGIQVPGIGRLKAIKKPVVWKPTTQAEALEFEEKKAKLKLSGWKPTTMEEAVAFEKAKAGLKTPGWKPKTMEEAIGFEAAKAKLKPKEYKPITQAEALSFEAAKADIKSPLGTPAFQKDVAIAQQKISEGADPFQIFQTMSLEYPKASTWLKRQLIEKSSTAQSIEDLIGELN